MDIKYTDGFKEDMKELFSDDWYYCLRRKWGDFKRIPRTLRHKRQRMQRGWSTQDVWGAYHHIAAVASGMIRHLANNSGGWPGGNDKFPTPESWQKHLLSIADKIEAYNIMGDMPDGWTGEKEEEAYEITQEGLREMTEIFGHLWD